MMNLYQRFLKSFKQDKEIWLTLAVALTIVAYGFEKRLASLEECWGTVSTYVTAEYSETTTEVDMDGNLTTEVDTWSEPASEVYKAITLNGELYSFNNDFSPVERNSVWYPPMPAKREEMSIDVSFDNFENRTDTRLTLKVRENLSGEVHNVNQRIGKTKSCLNQLGSTIVITTWYGIAITSDL